MASGTDKRRKLLARILTEHFRKWSKSANVPLLSLTELQRRIVEATREEVSQKTLIRDFSYLESAHDVQVIYDRGERGWMLARDPGDKLSDLQLKETDVIPLLVARDALGAVRGRRFEVSLRRLIDAICSDIGLELRRPGETFSLEDCIKFKAVGAAEAPSPHFDTVVNAVLGRLILRAVYRSRDRSKEPVERVLHPHLLHCYRDQWRLVAWEPEKQRMSTFLLSGFLSVEAAETEFDRQPDFSPEVYFDGSFGVFAGSGDHSIEIHFTAEGAERVRGRAWHKTQMMEDLPGGGLIFRARVNSLIEVSSWVLGFGPEAWAVAPPAFVERVRSAVDAARGRYADPTCDAGKLPAS